MEKATEVRIMLSQLSEETTVDNEVVKPSKCDPIPLAGLQLKLSNMIKEIEKKRKSLDDQRAGLIKGVTDIEGQIREDQERMRTLIMQSIKWFFDEMMAAAEKKITDVFKQLEGAMNPNETKSFTSV